MQSDINRPNMHGHVMSKDQKAQVVYVFLCSFVDEKGYMPTLADIIVGVDMPNSTSQVVKYLERLEEWGWIDRRDGHRRIVITGAKVHFPARLNKIKAQFNWENK